MKTFSLILTILVLVLIQEQSKAQTPSNDDCSGAIMINTNINCITTNGNVNGATDSGIPISLDCPTSNPDDDVWYSFVATCSTQAIQVTGSASFDPAFEVFSGICGALTSILCNANGGMIGGTAYQLFTVVPGQTYYVRVFDYGVAYSTTTSFTICVIDAAPYNDNCIFSIPLYATSTCLPITGNVCAATQGIGGDYDVWYRFLTSPNQTTCTITVVGSFGFDPVFRVSYGCSQGPSWYVNATGVGDTETVSLTGLSAGHNYYISVWDSSGFPTTSTFSICVTDSLLNNISNPYSMQSHITISPNPFSTQTVLQTDNLLNNANLSVYNSFGQLVRRINNISEQTIIFLRDNLPTGLYFLHLTQDNKLFITKKLVITDN